MGKQQEIKQRTLEEARYLTNNKATVREVARAFNVSKSTVFNDLTKRLENINFLLSDEVRNVLDYNKSQRHIRGGLATKKKYSEKK